MAKTKFRTQYTEHVRMIAPAGSKIEIRHRAEMQRDGKRILVHDRKVDTYALIQSNREECEIENIIRRSIMGDYNALNQAVGQYADITGMPKSIAEAQQLVINLKESFDKLPKEVRAKFEFNPEMYVAEFGSDEWAKKVGVEEVMKQRESQLGQKIEFDKNLTEAVKNLATGKVIVQKGEENE